MERHYKLSKIEKDGITEIRFFFCKKFLFPVEKILKHRLSQEELFHQTNKYLQGLNEDKDFFSKFILATRQREGWEKKLCSVIQFHPQRDLTTVYNILSESIDV